VQSAKTSLHGAATDTYEYDAFGNLLNKAGTTPNNYLYRGEQYDPDLGLYYLRARYYNPLTGRFMSRDPEDGKAEDPASLHKYLYAGGDPVNLADPTGRDYIESIFAEPVVISSPLEIAVADTGYAVAKAFCFIAKMIARAQIPPGMLGFGPPGWPGPAKILCEAFGF
jgi:RHS repeat-associated protein